MIQGQIPSVPALQLIIPTYLWKQKGQRVSKGQQSFNLKVNRNSDTRFMDTAAAVITQDEIPKGTVFTCQGKTYYPNGGSVYIPLSVGEKISVIMNTENTAGLTPGGHTLSVRIFPAGVHVGGRILLVLQNNWPMM